MNRSHTAGVAKTLLISLAAFALGGAAQAATTMASAAVDDVGQSVTRTDGGAAVANATSGAGTASALAGLTSLHSITSDVGHFSVGAPGAGARSDFLFEVQGGTGLVTLDFNFKLTATFDRDDVAGSFTNQGTFSALVDSSVGETPYKYGHFVIVQCLGCGGRLGGGNIQTFEDYYGPGAVTNEAWNGGPLMGDFTLRSTFLAGTPGAGRLALEIGGGGGNSGTELSLFLSSITTSGPSQGLSIYDADSGLRFGVGSATAAAPEPATWALALIGFGLAGAALRRRAAAAA